MAAYRDDVILTETLERIRRAELATVLHPPGSPEHARAVERLDRATRQMLRLEQALLLDGTSADHGPAGRRQADASTALPTASQS